MQLPQNIKEKPTPFFSRKVEDLLAKMSIGEKAGQMTQIALDLLLEGEMYNAKIPQRIGMAASITPPAKRLKYFKKINLKPGGSKSVHFKLSEKDLQFVGRENTWISEPGKFSILIGNQSRDFELISA